MAVGRNGSYPSIVAIDLSTQADFLTTQGSYPVANLDELIPALRKIVAWAKWRRVPVVSSLNSHRPCELEHDAAGPYCVDGSHGQRKMLFTMMGSAVRVEGDNTLAVPVDLFESYQQVIFRQRTRDLLSNPKADRFLTQLQADRLVLYGVALETSVKALALGLRARNRSVCVVVDACGYWADTEADLAVRQLEAKGVQLTTVDALLRERLPRRFRSLSLDSNGHTNGSNGGNGTNGTNGSNGRGNGHSPASVARTRNGVFRCNKSNGAGTNGHRSA